MEVGSYSSVGVGHCEAVRCCSKGGGGCRARDGRVGVAVGDGSVEERASIPNSFSLRSMLKDGSRETMQIM